MLVPTVRPMLKWAGGKTQLLPEIFQRAPKVFNAYHEPFVGSAAVFFALAPQEATLSDTNLNLINLYKHTKNATGELSDALLLLEEKFNSLPPDQKSDYYYAQRTRFNSETQGSVGHSALMVFLNKTGFNGMYRENPKGEFNIPFGKKTKVNLPTLSHLESCKERLSRAEILHTGFESITGRAKPGDFVYFDPPYVPLSKTASFTSYQANGFSLADQARLASVFCSLNAQGVSVLLSNSDTPEVRDLYHEFTVDTVYARRNINSKGSGRGAVAEVLVRNY